MVWILLRPSEFGLARELESTKRTLDCGFRGRREQRIQPRESRKLSHRVKESKGWGDYVDPLAVLSMSWMSEETATLHWRFPNCCLLTRLWVLGLGSVSHCRQSSLLLPVTVTLQLAKESGDHLLLTAVHHP